MRSLIIFIFTAFTSTSLLSQEIDNYSSLHIVRRPTVLRVSYDNDLFVGTDRYYTQGIGVDFYSGGLVSNPFNVLLIGFSESDRNSYGLQFRTHGCTPTSILSDSVLVGDRPYAGVFSFGAVRISQQNKNRLRLTSQFELGMIGQAALGEEIQTGIHRLTKSDLPKGWQHQIKNSPIVNYTLRLEKGPTFSLPNYLNANIYGQVKAGTFQTNLSTGFEFSLGRSNTFMIERFIIYGYSKSSLTLVGYDASLMGGIINRDGYHLSYSEINPFVFRQHVGLVAAWRRFSIGFDLAFMTQEIKAGLPHTWGGFRLAFY